MKNRKNRQRICAALLLVVAALLVACGAQSATNEAENEQAAQEDTAQETEQTTVVSVGGQPVAVDESLAQNELSAEDFETDAQTGRIICTACDTLTGVDVSSYQGEIDWAAVAADGIDFAMLRIGNRGYTEGGLKADSTFEANYAGATEQGLMVGVYFFSQAISAEEAQEEAEFVLSILDGKELSLPIVFDWEEITGAQARTDDLDGTTVTQCALTFCAVVQQAGYEAGFYCNGTAGYLIYDLSQLQEVDAWYAEYGDYPSFAYSFHMWQYSKTGTVAGISGNVDLNLYFLTTE